MLSFMLLFNMLPSKTSMLSLKHEVFLQYEDIVYLYFKIWTIEIENNFKMYIDASYQRASMYIRGHQCTLPRLVFKHSFDRENVCVTNMREQIMITEYFKAKKLGPRTLGNDHWIVTPFLLSSDFRILSGLAMP